MTPATKALLVATHLKEAMDEGAAVTAVIALELLDTQGATAVRGYLLQVLADIPPEIRAAVAAAREQVDR
jgi:hypothetical protein